MGLVPPSSHPAAPLVLTSTNPASAPLVLQGAVGQTQDLLDLRDGSGNDVIEITDTGDILVGTLGVGAATAAEVKADRITVGALGFSTRAITSGALPTVALVSGAGAQVSTARDVEAVTPVTFNPTAGAAATCVVALSPDNATYSAVGTETEPAGIAFDGTIHLVRAHVPAGWYLRLTVTNATIGTTTYY